MIKNRRGDERPRERLGSAGPAGLSLRELLALLLGSGPPGVGCLGVAGAILDRLGQADPAGEERAFFASSINGAQGLLDGIRGLGPVGRTRLEAALELGRRQCRFHRVPTSGLPATMRWSQLEKRAIASVPLLRRCAQKEWLGFTPIQRDGQVGAFCPIDDGLRSGVLVDVQELFARVLATRPAALCLFHNHPTGDLTPSAADLDLTREVDRIATSLGVRLLGHWIVTGNSQALVGLAEKV